MASSSEELYTTIAAAPLRRRTEKAYDIARDAERFCKGHRQRCRLLLAFQRIDRPTS